MKNISIIISFIFLFIGCGEKPIVVKGKIDRPIKQTTTRNPSPILGKPVGSVNTNPLENPSVIMGQEVRAIDLNQTTIPAVDNNINTVGEVQDNSEPVMDPTMSQSYVTTLKTKKFSFSDAGFMQEENGVIDLQILTAGKPLVTLKISSDVCVNHNCISKEEFNQDYLSSSYPADLINNVLTRRPIFEGKNLKRTSNGFMQKITSSRYNIKYKTTPSSIYFKDLKNNLIIKMRRLK
jgi:hypothetical protein